MPKQTIRINDYVSFYTKKFGKDTVGIVENYCGKCSAIITVKSGTFKPHHYVKPMWMLRKVEL